MKKHIIGIVLFIFILGAGAFAEQVLTPLNGGNTLFTETIDESAVIEQNGELYVVYISGGSLYAKVSADDRNSFSSIVPNLEGSSFTTTRDLMLYQRGHEDSVVFFIGKASDGTEGVYALEVNGSKSLHIGYSGRLDRDTKNGAIDKYTVAAGHGDEFGLYYTKSGVLRFAFSASKSSIQNPVTLSTSGEGVLGFEVNASLNGAAVEQWGYYTTQNGSLNSVYVFSVTGGIINENTQVDTAAAANARVGLKRNRNGNKIVAYETLAGLVFKKKTSTAWDLVDSTALPLFDSISDFRLISVKDGFSGYVVGSEGGVQNVYTVALADSDSELSIQGPLNSASINSDVKFLENSLSSVLAFQENSGEAPRVYSLEKAVGYWIPEQYYSRTSGTVKSFYVAQTGHFEPVVVTVFEKDGVGAAELYFPGRQIWGRQNDPVVVGGVPTDAVFSVQNKSVIFSGGSKTVVYDIETMQQETFSAGGLSSLASLDGRTSVSVLGGKLYKTSDLPKPPAGAFETFGDPLLISTPYVRLYGWEQNSTTDLSFEIQYQGFIPYVVTAGETVVGNGFQGNVYRDRSLGDSYSLEIWEDEVKAFVFSGEIQTNNSTEGMRVSTSQTDPPATKKPLSISLSSEFAGPSLSMSGSKLSVDGADGSMNFAFTQIVDGAFNAFSPIVGGSKIVFTAYVEHDYEIFMWEDGQLTQITDNNFDDGYPHTDGNSIVWQRGVEGNMLSNAEIILWKDGVEKQISHNQYHDFSPKVFGGIIVWNGKPDSFYQVYKWQNDNITQLTRHNWNSQYANISDFLITWSSETDNEDGEVYYQRDGGDPIRVTHNDFIDYEADLWENTFVWVGGHSGHPLNVFYWANSQTTNLTNNSSNEVFYNSASVNNSNIVWIEGPSNFSNWNEHEVYLRHEGVRYKLTENSIREITVDISNKYIVWDASDGIYFIDVDSVGPVLRTQNISNGNSLPTDSWSKDIVYVRLSEIRDSEVGIPSGVDESTLEYRINSGDWTSITVAEATNVGVEVVDEGTHTVEFRCADNDGNSTTVSTTVNIDKAAPVISDLGTYPDWESEVTILATATDHGGSGLDETSWQYKRYAADIWTDGNPNTFDLSGENTISFRVKDNAGNYAEASTTLKIDRGPPTVTGITITDSESQNVATNDWSNKPPLTVTALAEDLGIGVDDTTWEHRIKLAGQSAFSSWQSGKSVELTENGAHTVEYRVQDLLGSLSDATAFTVQIDTLSPDIGLKKAPGQDSPANVTIDGVTYTSIDGHVIVSAYNSI